MVSDFTNSSNFKRKFPGKNNQNASKLIDKYTTLAKEALSKVVRCGMMNPFEGYAICELEQTESCFLGKFRNFGQYRFQSWVLDSFVLTIVLPKKTQMKIEVVLD